MSDTLAENHERIWLQPRCHIGDRCWSPDPQPCDECGEPAVKYVRFDIARAEVEQLRDEIKRLRSDKEWLRGVMRNAIAAQDWDVAKHALDDERTHAG